MMTRKLFTLVARILREHVSGVRARTKLALAFCDIFAEANPRFDAAKFLAAANAGDVKDTLVADYDERGIALAKELGGDYEARYRALIGEDAWQRATNPQP